jgi:hypothetical protein
VFELATPVEESRTRAAVTRALRTLPRLGVAVLFALIGYTKFDDDPQGEWVMVL